MAKHSINVRADGRVIDTYSSKLVPEKGDILHKPGQFFAMVKQRNIDIEDGEVDLFCIIISAEEAGYA